MSTPNYDLKSFKDYNILDQSEAIPKIEAIETKYLHHFTNHPFKLYTGERLTDMVDSIKANGVFLPIIVRPIENDNFNYEVLSGHNRLEASKIAGLENIPCIIKENLTEDEARLIVTETNLIQRSFSDLTHSERATIVAVHYEAMKKQGKRNDVILAVENLLFDLEKAYIEKENETCVQSEHKLKTRDETAEKYGLSKSNVVRYLRIDKLIEPLKELLDEKKLYFITCVTLSYLTENEQNILYELILKHECGINNKKADQLKQLSSDKKFTVDLARQIILGNKNSQASKKQTTLKFKRKTFANYFDNSKSQEQIEKMLLTALEFYFENKYNEELKDDLRGEDNIDLDDDELEEGEDEYSGTND